MYLVLFSGLPGTGKSTYAEIVGRKLGIPVFAKDWLQATLIQCGIASDGNAQVSPNYASYELLTMLAQRQMTLQQSCILDSVASTKSLRTQWHSIAMEHNADWRVIECVCSDETLHRSRLTARKRHIPGGQELSWEELLQTRLRYTSWTEKRLIIDSVNTLDTNVELVLHYIQTSG